jgi:Ras family protein T1
MEGFLYLHKMFIQKGRLETTWKTLRVFGYDDDLSLRASFLYPKMKVGSTDSVELSSEGIQFFTELFQKCDNVRSFF